jgi:hypothetical protein
MDQPRKNPKIQKLELVSAPLEQLLNVPLEQLGASTFGRPIPEEDKRIHAAAIRRALKQQTR